MFNTIEVAKKIRSARQAKNMTQMALADAMGVSFQAVSNWERGNSLPDIGKLPDLCRILDLDIQTLLGEDQKETKTIEKLMKEEAVPLRDLAEVAPMLPPQQVESSFRRETKNQERINAETLLALAPFLDEEYLDRLADRIVAEDIATVVKLAPFLSEEALDRMVERFEGKSDTNPLHALLPFLSERTLEKMADRILESENGSLKELIVLAPFLSEKSLREAADKAIRRNDFGTLKDLSYFL